MGALVARRGRGREAGLRGRVGTGFSDRQRARVGEEARRAGRVDQPRAERVPKTKDAHWVEPTVVVRVRLHRVDRATAPCASRAFSAMREDKDADGVRARADGRLRDAPERRAPRAAEDAPSRRR